MWEQAKKWNFNPRSHEGSDPREPGADCERRRYFNPRSHEGSDSGQQWVCDEIDLFQSTLPRGERRSLHSVSCIVERISIHAPTRGATKTTLQANLEFIGFQSTLPRGERRVLLRFLLFLVNISIHAPTRGATLMITANLDEIPDFNPRSHEGSDYASLSDTASGAKFQSTLPRGERRLRAVAVDGEGGISIHAPTRGATYHCCLSASWEYNFNPRSHEGSDFSFLESENIQFHFNPRSHEGSDMSRKSLARSAIRISIHAPTRGATFCCAFCCSSSIFQSTLPRGERPAFHAVANNLTTFQSTLPRGERHYSHACGYSSGLFQSTLPRGERPAAGVSSPSWKTISIHAPTRGATPHEGRSPLPLRDFNPRSHEGSDMDKGCRQLSNTIFQSTLPRGERRRLTSP